MAYFEDEIMKRALIDPSAPLAGGEDDEILGNEEYLARAAGMFDGYQDILALTIRSRCMAISRKMQLEFSPIEIALHRQSLVELAALYDQLSGYSTEYKARSLQREIAGVAAQIPEGTDVGSPPPGAV
jgi:hypothetical protein